MRRQAFLVIWEIRVAGGLAKHRDHVRCDRFGSIGRLEGAVKVAATGVAVNRPAAPVGITGRSGEDRTFRRRIR